MTLTSSESVWLAFVAGMLTGIMGCLIAWVVAQRRGHRKAGQRDRDLGTVSPRHMADLHIRAGKD